ncbi:uncharacterized protein LOC107056272 isoform X1 [Gallus gallus]|uniref:uncharacterized protein LOC107056272 isoform X1 n=1 Tax=Gallus gallus TaxID=9031 RepID=UPI001AE25B2E|nr:uncharacterized protein LOC107056272 isoform X1 [Gallus gallus]
MSHGAELQPRLFSLAAAKLPPKALSPPAPSCPHARSSEEPLLPSAHDLIFHPKRPFLGLTFTCGLLGPLQPPAAGLGSCWPRGQRHPLVARRAEGAPCPAAMGSCVAKNPRLTAESRAWPGMPDAPPATTATAGTPDHSFICVHLGRIAGGARSARRQRRQCPQRRGRTRTMELRHVNQVMLEVLACIVLAYHLSQANVFFFYLLLLLPLIFLFEEPIGT